MPTYILRTFYVCTCQTVSDDVFTVPLLNLCKMNTYKLQVLWSLWYAWYGRYRYVHIQCKTYILSLCTKNWFTSTSHHKIIGAIKLARFTASLQNEQIHDQCPRFQYAVHPAAAAHPPTTTLRVQYDPPLMLRETPNLMKVGMWHSTMVEHMPIEYYDAPSCTDLSNQSLQVRCLALQQSNHRTLSACKMKQGDFG